MTVKEVAKIALKNRADRFQRLLNLDAPTYILVNELVLILKALAMLDADATGMALGEILNNACRISMGRCIACDIGEVELPAGLCEACYKKEEAGAKEMLPDEDE